MSETANSISDGYHTFRELYEERTALFCALCNLMPEISWKSKKHFDEANDPMYEGDFLAGIDSPDGTIAFHVKLEYWDEFDIPEIDHAPYYDGYSSKDVLARTFSLAHQIEHPPCL